ncbi:MAG: cytochrome c biogenesis protein CcdA [Planctomycetota bacterium]
MDILKGLVEQGTSSGSITVYLFVFLGGLATSFTPCVYPVIPLIVGFIGAQQIKSRWSAFLLSVCYVIGLSLTFSVIGVLAALSGQVFGNIQNSPYSFLVVGNFIVIMALWLMDIIYIPLPAFRGTQMTHKGYIPSFILGATSGLIAIPCTTAILAVILAYVGQHQNPAFGGTLLFTYGLGVGVILIVCGTFTGFINTLMKSEKLSIIVKKVFSIGLLVLAEYFFIQAGKGLF